MRSVRIVLPLLVALLAAACARQQPRYYIVDPATGQPVPVVQQYNPASYGRPAFGQPAYGQPAYGAPRAYAQPHAHPHDGRGLLSSHRGLFGRRHSAPVYARGYPPPGYGQPHYAQGGYVQQQPYGQGSYTLQYRPPRPAGGYVRGTNGYGGYAYAPAQQPYTLDSGDKLRVVVFGQQGITGTYMVDAGGSVSLPLIGTVPARGFTTNQLASMIGERLKQGYVREPHVTVEIAAYRPFFILGEVTNPGQYPYVANMTAENAIAIAGGFAPRADKRQVELTRNAGRQHFKGKVPLNYPLRPGDTVVVKERWF